MSEEKWTKEPWEEAYLGSISLEGRWMADFRLYGDAARSVICVNACTGLEDPAAALRAAREALSEYLDWLELPVGTFTGPDQDRLPKAARKALELLGKGDL